jgi:hypothetical protein
MSADYQRRYRKAVKEVNSLLQPLPELDDLPEEMQSYETGHSRTTAYNCDDVESSCKITDPCFHSSDVQCISESSSTEDDIHAGLVDAESYVYVCREPSVTSLDDCDLAAIDCDEPPLSSTEDEQENVPRASLQSDLANWVVDAKLPRESCNALLGILRQHGCDLPKDSRTLLKTPKNVLVEQKCGGQYIYLGLEKILQKATEMDANCDILFIQVNVDGLPLYKSSAAQLWPILCCVNHGVPMIAALYFGQNKPCPVEEFTEQFVEEFKTLLDTGFECNDGRRLPVALHSFICDAPARAMLKNIKAHNSLYGCERCVAKGSSQKGRTTFLDDKCMDADLRTDEKFASLSYLHSHQNGPSPMSSLSEKCVSLFVLDYMHLVCLGAVRRMLNFWKRGDKSVRIANRHVVEISEKLASMRSCIPSEFVRRPRSLTELDRWKATELRQFLLYTGPVALKGCLQPDLYHHFLALSIAVNILVTSDDAERQLHLDYAAKLLRYFVTNCSRLYGENFLVYNIHSLLHLADDVRNFSLPLDKISAFKFENFLHKLKKWVRSPSNPLVQVGKRLQECENFGNRLLESRDASQMKLYAGSRDSIVQLQNGRFAEIVSVKDDVYRCRVFRSHSLQPYFVEPCSSDIFDIYYLPDHSIRWRACDIVLSDIKRKGLRLRCCGGSVLMPLRHGDYSEL